MAGTAPTPVVAATAGEFIGDDLSDGIGEAIGVLLVLHKPPHVSGQTCKDPELTERVLSRGEIEASASNGGEDPQVDWGGPGNGAGGSRS